jgi:hypothetical protein
MRFRGETWLGKSCRSEPMPSAQLGPAKVPQGAVEARGGPSRGGEGDATGVGPLAPIRLVALARAERAGPRRSPRGHIY